MATVRKRTWKTAGSEAKTAWVVDYTDSRGERQQKYFSHKKAECQKQLRTRISNQY
jgi:integrase